MLKMAQRMQRIPTYLFAKIDKKKEEAKRKGIDLIDLSIGDPDIPTPAHIVEKMKEAVSDPKNHRYPSYEGMIEFREAISEWYKKRFGVDLDPEKEILTLLGSKDGISHIPFVFLDNGDLSLVPSPAYPVYKIMTLLAGGIPYIMPLYEENDYLPEIEKIPASVAEKAKLMFINYPNNPTGAHANDRFYEELIAFAKKYGIIVCHDAAYSEIYFDDQKPKSILEYDRKKEISVEFHSLSKTYCMTGWRIGFVVGRKDVISALGRLKANIDSGVFQAIQLAAREALLGDQSCVEEIRQIYKKRRDILTSGLESIGFSFRKPFATFYLWVRVPSGFNSESFCEYLIEKAGIVVTPGSGFGEEGEGYFRISLTTSEERIKEGLERLKKLFS
ncbi:MAG: LL-diaminopimelate aminotransferase [Desulfobacterota bacterium]|nr:LL-diaminopimelate aminotransferase [Thermodesulfobacteriota bacterium]